ncbi:cytochrome d ubiquinol oxidase subunit II, partial [Singulisphaera rosea]
MRPPDGLRDRRCCLSPSDRTIEPSQRRRARSGDSQVQSGPHSMEAAWFAIVSGMLAAYAVLDGFDFGVGILHRIVARTDDERRTT